MGLLDRFRRSHTHHIARSSLSRSPHEDAVSTQTRTPTPSSHKPTRVANGFTVIDVETTGLSPAQHRVLEVAVVRTDERGRVVGEWSRRVNPGGPVGATHVHGITAADVADEPPFAELVPHLNAWLADSVVVAHHARFDMAFLRSEYGYAGWQLPWLPTLCTLEASTHYLPLLDRRRLADCCAATRIRHTGQHSALGDARATAALLGHYLDPRRGVPPRPEDLGLLSQTAAVVWPTHRTLTPSAPQAINARGRSRPEVQRIRINAAAASKVAVVPNLVDLLADFSLADALDEGAPAGSLAYLEKLAEVLEDGELSPEEAADLDDVAATQELNDEARDAAHGAFLLALCHLALDDGQVSRAERAELNAMADLLGMPQALVKTTLDHADDARQARLSAGLSPLPESWSHGDPVRVGDKVAFTGCDPAQRQDLESRATELGVRVMNNVSRRTAMLVTDGGFAGTKAEAARNCGARLVHPDVFAQLLTHLQPAEPRSLRRHATPTVSALRSACDPPSTAAPVQSAAGAPFAAAGANLLVAVVASEVRDSLTAAAPLEPPLRRPSPAVVRQWARDNGYPVGDRGRLPQDLFDAYEAASADD